MGLVDVAVLDVLVVIDRLGGVLEVACLLGLFEIADVPDKGNGITIAAWASAVALVEFVVQDEELLVLGVKNPALVGVCSTLVGDTGDDVGDVSLVGHIVDCESILVIAVANIATLVTLVRSAVDNTLRIMNIAITLGATKRLGLGRISQIEEVETGSTDRVISRHSADSNGVLELLVNHNIMRTTNGKQSVEVASKVLLGIEDHGLLGINFQKLLEVEDLNTVADGFGSDDDVILVAADLTPLGRRRVLRKTAEVDELALLGDLCEGGSVVLADGDEFTAIVRCPAPRR